MHIQQRRLGLCSHQDKIQAKADFSSGSHFRSQLMPGSRHNYSVELVFHLKDYIDFD